MADLGMRAPCPTCGRMLAYSPANPWRPFCSGSCRGHDLGAWASERFRIADAGGPPGEGDPSNLASQLTSDSED